MKESRYILRKFIMAKSAAEALRKEKKTVVADVWVDEKWLEQEANRPVIVEGFKPKK